MADEGARIKFDFGRKNSSPILAYPSNLRTEKDKIAWVKFKFFSYKTQPLARQRDPQASAINAYNGPESNRKYVDHTICLYSPEDIQAEYGVQWGGRSIQNFTKEIISKSAGLGNPGAVITNLTENLINGQTFKSGGAYLFSAATAAALQGLQAIGQGEGLGLNDVLGGTAGVVLNPNTELLFQGFDLRNFNLQFKLVAYNKSDADEIQRITRLFKKMMLPSINSGVDKTSKYTVVTEDEEGKFAKDRGYSTQQVGARNFIRIPKLCEIDFMYGSTPNPYITQFKPCAITGFTINQTPDGLLSLYERGEPTAITININFQETKLVYSEDINTSIDGVTY